MWRFVLALGAMLIAAGCTTNWVHPDPDADWDAAYADCFQKAEAAGSDETHEQVMKDCLEAKGWVKNETRKPRRSSRPRQPSQPSRPRTPRPY